MKLKYAPLPEFEMDEAVKILNSGVIDDLIILPLSLGEYCPNWKAAQDICVKLASHENEQVRANAGLGLAYIARTKGKLEKHIVKPVMLELLNNCCEYRWRVIDSIHDINIFMKWHLGEKALKRFEESMN